MTNEEVNALLENIAAKFEAHETWDLWRSDAAALVRSFKRDMADPVHDRPAYNNTGLFGPGRDPT